MQPRTLQSPNTSRSCSPARPRLSSSGGTPPAAIPTGRLSSSGSLLHRTSSSGGYEPATRTATGGPSSPVAGRDRATPRSRMQSTVTSATVTSAPTSTTQQSHAEVMQTKGGNWVAKPPKGVPVKGIIHFLGGAFAGAAPQVMYTLLIDQLAWAGFTVIATPYAVTFKHLECADIVRSAFVSTLEELRQNSATAYLVPAEVPVFGVGHSMGSLMHLLINSSNPGATDGNVCISFNNKDISAAMPLPGFLDTLSPALAALQQVGPLPIPTLDSEDVLKTLSTFIPAAIKRDEAGQLSGAALALDQIKSVFGEVGNGVTDFSPSPAGSRRIIRTGYNTRKSPLLLVKFTNDSIDESSEMHALLQQRPNSGVGVTSVTLPGSHTTPCTGDVKWETGAVLTPLDAFVQIAKWQTQADVRRLGDTVTNWLKVQAQTVQANKKAAQVATQPPASPPRQQPVPQPRTQPQTQPQPQPLPQSQAPAPVPVPVAVPVYAAAEKRELVSAGVK